MAAQFDHEEHMLRMLREENARRSEREILSLAEQSRLMDLQQRIDSYRDPYQRSYGDWGDPAPPVFPDIGPYIPQEENKMTTAFELDLDNNRLSFGTIADGQMVDLDAEIKLKSERGTSPIGGKIKGNFIGELKGTKTIPITIPHKLENAGGFNIIVIGSGGTGGYLIRDLARFAYALKEKGDTRPVQIKLVDADVVEEKNVLRQNFTPRDLGKSKAEVMAKRYSNAFGLEIQAVNKMIETGNDLTTLFERDSIGGRAKSNIIVGCVDNNKARRIVRNAVKNQNNCYWIDSGNETKSGQVVCGYGRHSTSSYWNPPSSNTQFWMPNVANLYPEIMDESEDEPEENKISCAERTLVDTQNIFVNMTAAGHVLSFIRQIVMEEPITINRIEFNIKGVSEVFHVTEGYLREAHEQARRQ